MEVMDEYQNKVTPMSVTDWVLTIFLSGIPLIGLILLFMWAFADNQKIERVNWAKATLVWYLIGIVFASIFFMIFGVAFLAGMAGMD